MSTIVNNQENLKKKNIIENIFLRIGISKAYSTKIINDIIHLIIINLRLHKKTKIHNFGTFTLLKKKKRVGRNPKNKVKHEIPERVVVSFKASAVLKKKINKNV